MSRFTPLILMAFAGVFVAVGTLSTAQNGASIAPPADQARIKPLVEAETKAREALQARTAALPESAKVKAAKEAYDKAVADLDKATQGLPEHQEWLKANAAAAKTAYQIMADHKLSSLEYKPEVNDRKELVFTRIPAKP